jgi:Leucine-rich repeat (LRR) protein
LSYNQIETLNGFPGSNLSKLVKLSLKKNNLFDLRGIDTLVHLNYLKLSRNNLSSLQEIKLLAKVEYFERRSRT